MDSQKLRQLFEAIKKDDLKTFKSLIISNSDLNLCFGRFPLLSVCYLFKSYKILNKFEKFMLTLKTFNITSEFYDIYLEFKKYAKKSLRFFMGEEIVYPIEMLAVLDEREIIAKNYKKLYKNDEILAKLQKIYSVNKNIRVESSTENFEAPPIKFNKHQSLYLSIIAVMMCFMIIFPIFCTLIMGIKSGVGTKNSPIHIANERELVSAMSNGSKNYILDNDIYLTDHINTNKFSGTLDGNDFTIYADENLSGAMITNLTGTIKNLSVVIIYENLKILENFSILAQNSTGIIKNCRILGNINAVFQNSADAYFSLFVVKNDGRIDSSTAEAQVSVTNDSNKNAYISAFAAVNNGEIENCKTSKSSFETETVDVAGFVIENYGKIIDCENHLDISQSSNKEWHPNTAGIAINNDGLISNVSNFGNITSITTNEMESSQVNSSFVLYSSGIVVNNVGTLEYVSNSGKVTGRGITCSIYVSGVACNNSFTYKLENNNTILIFLNIGEVLNSTNNGEIIAESKKESQSGNYIFASGVVACNFSKIETSVSNGKINCNSKVSTIYAGGVVACNNVDSNNMSQYIDNNNRFVERTVINSHSSGDMNLESQSGSIYAGGVVGYNYSTAISNSGYIGTIEVNSRYVVAGGVVGYNIYSSYSSVISNSYSGATFVDNYQDNNDDNTENSEETSSKYISMLIGIYLNNSSNIYMSNNYFVAYENYPAMRFQQQTIFGNTAISDIDAEKCGATVLGSINELLEYKANKEAENV